MEFTRETDGTLTIFVASTNAVIVGVREDELSELIAQVAEYLAETNRKGFHAILERLKPVELRLLDASQAGVKAQLAALPPAPPRQRELQAA
jgi:hypothetical protein